VDELFPAEQARIVQVLVERVDVQEDAREVRVRAAGLASLVGELRQGRKESGVMHGVQTRLDGDTLVVRIPMRFQRRGGRKRIVDAAPPSSPAAAAPAAGRAGRLGRGQGARPQADDRARDQGRDHQPGDAAAAAP
jgi:hypothetical protein